ncbi:MAG: ribonuclease HII [Spirochaetes bacterium]|nr:ribonuclease HII [Spirochaetota bacterium]
MKKKADRVSAFLHGPDFAIEKELLRKGCRLIAGVDEAGRGALAGPLCVGITIYAPSFIESLDGPLPGIDDSKKLTPRKRSAALELIRRSALFSASILVSHRTVDRLNINRATEYAINRLLENISIKPDIVILDGNFSFTSQVPIHSVPKGDARSVSIASASIEAKVWRDTIMDRMDRLWPCYNFTENKGYGTSRHIQAIRERGISPVHRLSYEPVRSMIAAGTRGGEE